MIKKVCGLDVHKDTIFCVIYDGKKTSEVKEYKTLAPDISRLSEYLQSEGVEEVAMESTASYWVPVWNILESVDFKLHLVNPYLIKQMPGRKSDVKDAQWIATLLHKGLIRSSLVPCHKIRELRTYSRKHMRLQQKRTSILQEIEKNLELCCIRITSFASHIHSRTVMKIVDHIIAGETDKEVFLSLVHGRIINSKGRENILDSLNGYITEHHRFILELLKEELNLIESHSEKCIAKMRVLVDANYKREYELLQTLPGVSELSAMIIIAETGADMKEFENSGRLSGWIGLRPRNDESAGKFKSTATTKGNKYLRTILVQVAWAASRTKDSYFKEKFNQLAIRKPRKKALIAIARKMGVLVWNLLQNNEPFDAKKAKIYDPIKLNAKLEYYKKEQARIELLLR